MNGCGIHAIHLQDMHNIHSTFVSVEEISSKSRISSRYFATIAVGVAARFSWRSFSAHGMNAYNNSINRWLIIPGVKCRERSIKP